MKSNYEKLLSLLEELFQLDQADLDFGIYRIMNQKRAEITRFLEKELLPQVQESFKEYKSVDKAAIEEELEKTIQSAQAAGFDPEQSPRVQELREKGARYGIDVTALENEVFSYLYNFFRRYYHEGDFLSLRRYKEGVYAIPYEGEEVKLYWANHDQYYIKTSEYLRDYTFKLPSGKRVHFKLMEADTEKDNTKAQNGKERRFFLCEQEPMVEADGELFIRFEYRCDPDKRKQKDINTQTAEQIIKAHGFIYWRAELAHLRPTEKNPKRTLLDKHLDDYTARNTFDYFIHKDLGGFLTRELDFYIKNEVMHLDDIEHESAPQVEQYLSKIRVIRKIAHKIINFLAQIENFQKKLWLKKKFVVETNYCVTLDRVPEELYPEIAANDAQREEWVRLFTIDEIKSTLFSPGYSKPLKEDFLKANSMLILDTRFFDDVFRAKLIASIDDFDEQCDGLLIHSENFQALNLLQKQYREKVKCIYIDPPYNTSSTPILYKNEYKHSSWVSLMWDRLALSKSLMQKCGVKSVAIDDTEMIILSKVLEDIYPEPEYRLSRITVVHNPKGSITKDFNRVHEYALFLTREEDKHSISRTLEENETLRKMRRWGENSLRTERRLSFYPIYVRGGKITRIGNVPPDDFHPSGRNVHIDSGEVEIWPIDQDGVERRWNFGLDTIKENIQRITIQEVDNTLDLFLTHELTVPKTVWTGGEFDAGNYGNTLLINILGTKQFDFPKSINLVKRCIYLITAQEKNSIVLDYFGGSGTTGHAVINLNREDNGHRKYILVEMADYFGTVLLPRIKKVIYSKDWKDGKPVSREGSSHMFKYLLLESYEDTLNNLSLKRTKGQQMLLDDSPSFRESYMLSYMLDVESRGSASLLNIDRFEDPFNYKLNIAVGSVGETKPTTVDLVETFNYLLGLTVHHIDHIRGFRVVQGTNPKGEKVLVIWRHLKEKSNEDLDEFFRRQEYNPKDTEFDLIYVNGDNNLENLRREDETWKVRLIEEEFHRLMFDVEDV